MWGDVRRKEERIKQGEMVILEYIRYLEEKVK